MPFQFGHMQRINETKCYVLPYAMLRMHDGANLKSLEFKCQLPKTVVPTFGLCSISCVIFYKAGCSHYE